jgi:hypothetical protein
MDRGIDGSKLALAGVAALAAVAVLRSRKGGRNTSDAESPPDEILGGMRAAQVEKDVEGGYRSRILRLTWRSGATSSS